MVFDKNALKEMDIKINDLLGKMTMEEKIGQLHQVGSSPVGGFEISLEEKKKLYESGQITKEQYEREISGMKFDTQESDVRDGKIGSFLGIVGADRCNHLQKIAVEESRLGIPLIFGLDVIHGYRTTFPIPLAEACSFDDEMFEKTAKAAASEAASEGIHWTFAPMLDVSRDARWGRIAESAGEDTYLTTRYAKAKVKGFQGENVADPDRVLACAKHFAAYGAAIGGRDYNTVDMSLQTLWNDYLPPFKAAADAGAATFMAAFNTLNGIPCTVNKYLLTTVLRDGFDFKGFVVSDSMAVAESIKHGVAADALEATEKAVNAGIDVDMHSHFYHENLKELVESGKVSEKTLDEAVRRVLRIKFVKGLFRNPYCDETVSKTAIATDENRKLALESAKRSMVLLKNDGVLPLKKNQKILLLGNLAVDRLEQLGTWTTSPNESDTVTLADGLLNIGADFEYLDGYGLEDEIDFERLKNRAESFDTVIAVMGEKSAWSGEASSFSDIGLRGTQTELLKALENCGKPFTVVLFNGRPLAIPEVDETANAILEAWHPGTEGGNAIAQVLFGAYNPSGRLSATFPRSSGECPFYYNHFSTGKPAYDFKFSSRYLNEPIEPLYPFGYGLSFARYEYSNLKVRVEKGKVIASVHILNTGKIDGEETAQLYIRDMSASIARPVKELKGYKKVWLKAGESKNIVFELNVDELGFYNENLQYVVEQGEFRLFICHDSSCKEYAVFTI